MPPVAVDRHPDGAGVAEDDVQAVMPEGGVLPVMQDAFGHQPTVTGTDFQVRRGAGDPHPQRVGSRVVPTGVRPGAGLGRGRSCRRSRRRAGGRGRRQDGKRVPLCRVDGRHGVGGCRTTALAEPPRGAPAGRRQRDDRKSGNRER